MSRKDKHADHEDMPPIENDYAEPREGEQPLTPAQIAELEERKKPWLEKFKAIVDEAASRQMHGTSLPPTFVHELRALYDEMAGADGTPPAPPPEAV
jgi:hypothetical protein